MEDTKEVTIIQPTEQEIIAWWKWAAKFSKDNSPFQIGWSRGQDLTNQFQPQDVSVYCLACTAAQGGKDNEIRPLDAAISSGRNILIPIFVACATTLDYAKQTLGSPSLTFFVNGIAKNPSYLETDIGDIEFAENNAFDRDAGNQKLISVGYWANLVAPKDLQSLQFGGFGGQKEYGEVTPFETLVTYGLKGDS